MRILISIAMLSMCSFSFADDLSLNPSQCASDRGLSGQPIVATRQVAKEIYKSIYKGLFPKKVINDSRIMISEEDDHWVVYQRIHAPIITQDNSRNDQEKITVSSGGDVEMEIDKCTAAIKIYFSR